MTQRFCRCGHRKYKHNSYPLDTPYCKGSGVDLAGFSCCCGWYKPIDNLEWLEQQYNKQVSKNVSR